jgi:F-type H+-transporting ATPase subunit epsilon
MAEAIADTIELEVVTPERQLVKEAVTEAQVPAREGYIGVLPGHAPLLSLLGSGPLTYTPKSGARKVLAIHGGFVEVLPDHIRVLANLAERAEEIDVEKARAALKQANERLTMHDQAGATDPAVALEESELARARVDAAELR